jgi:potassium-dependent mechanosensitive channel
MRGLVLRTILLLGFVVLATAAYAQSTTDNQVVSAETKIESLKSRLASVKSIIDTPELSDDDLLNQKSAIEVLRLEITAEQSKLNGPLTEVRQQAERIGQPPEAGLAEPPAIAAQRRILVTRSARLTAAQKQLELLDIEAQQGVSKISTLQRDQFFQRIFKADKSVLDPRLWLETVTGLGEFATRTGNLLLRSWHQSKDQINFAGLILFPVGAGLFYLAWRLIGRFFVGRLRPRYFGDFQPADDISQMTPIARLLRVIVGSLASFVSIMLALVLFHATLNLAGLLTRDLETLIQAATNVLVPTLTYGVVTYLVCAPRRPEARLVAVDERAARLLPLLILAATFALSYGAFFYDVSELLNLPLNLLAGQSAVSTIAMLVLIGLILLLIKEQAKKELADGSSYFMTWFVKFLPVIWILLGIAAAALALGYISLAYFISSNIIHTALFGIVVALIHYLADAISEAALNPSTSFGLKLRDFLGLTERGVARIALIFRTLVDIVLVLISIPVLFIIWTVTWVDFRSVLNSLVSGITIGNITISPSSMLIAAIVLVIGVLLTRSLTGWLQRRVLSETTLDKGVQDSVRTGTSYLGYLIAVALALAAAGIDFSNIAIIAGALGVGIGFGLQSIVNNFVSGLILLAERPVRVGDWVVTNAGEGIVKKINVRSTEIETFDNCTVIVPNSNLITESVRNWTHRDSVGRLGVNVIVLPGAKVEVVTEILKTIAKDHPKILRYPEPQVTLSKFTIHGWEFDVKGHVADVFEAARVASDLRISIAQAFAKKRIKMVAQP